MMGQVSTHFFFVVSGMLMTDSIVRHGSTDSPERAAIMLCIQRIKPLIFPLWVSILFMSVQLVLPIMLAITFSGESRLSHIFTFSWMKYFAPLSRSIYLNHWVANIIVAKLFADKNYLFCLATLIFITLVSCLLNYFLVFCIKKCMVSLKIKYLKR